MIYEKIDLYAALSIPREGRTGGYLTVYARSAYGDLAPKKRPAALILPGGGYGYLSAREAEPVALRFLDRGYVSAVLEYTINTAYPVPLIEAAMAVVYLKSEAEKYALAGKVCAVGFSAGGHLAGMLATLFHAEEVKAALGKRAPLARPDAAVLSYPVITTGIHTHGGTADIISGGDETLRKKLSVEHCVTKDSVPAFIWHTRDDGAVPVQNALLLAAAYTEHGVPYEMHVFESGVHGLSVANTETASPAAPWCVNASVQRWLEMAFYWLESRGFTVTD